MLQVMISHCSHNIFHEKTVQGILEGQSSALDRLQQASNLLLPILVGRNDILTGRLDSPQQQKNDKNILPSSRDKLTRQRVQDNHFVSTSQGSIHLLSRVDGARAKSSPVL